MEERSAYRFHDSLTNPIIHRGYVLSNDRPIWIREVRSGGRSILRRKFPGPCVIWILGLLRGERKEGPIQPTIAGAARLRFLCGRRNVRTLGCLDLPLSPDKPANNANVYTDQRGCCMGISEEEPWNLEDRVWKKDLVSIVLRFFQIFYA